MVTFDDTKRLGNIAKHGIDLCDCAAVFDGPMLTIEDTRADYGEQRLKTLGLVTGRVVVLIWTERAEGPHLISCRWGDKHETKVFFRTLQR